MADNNHTIKEPALPAGVRAGDGNAEPYDSRGPTTLEGWKSAALAGEKERDWLRERLRTVDRHQGKDCWYWQNDGEDHLESMTNALPVVIRADHLRELLAAAPAVSAPAGWKLVPIEATDDMMNAGKKVQHDGYSKAPRERSKRVYAAMLAAAPAFQAPVTTQGEQP